MRISDWSSDVCSSDLCASGLEAVNNVAAQIMAGMSQAGIGGGVESMSRTFMGADSGAWCADPRVALHNYYAPQGIGADIIPPIDGFTREAVDIYAAESPRRAAHSLDEGHFSKSVLPLTYVLGHLLLHIDDLGTASFW